MAPFLMIEKRRNKHSTFEVFLSFHYNNWRIRSAIKKENVKIDILFVIYYPAMH